MQLSVAQYFTYIDGTSPIYIGREIIIPSTSAWPIPHDAPFKPQLDSTIMAITEVISTLVLIDTKSTLSEVKPP